MDVKLVNDMNLALEIMRQASRWMTANGIPVMDSWRLENLNARAMLENYGATDKDFYVCYIDGAAAGARILVNAKGAYRGLLPYGFENSLYTGKGCAADGFHGGKYSALMMNAVKDKARAEGYDSVVLDTGKHQPKLCALFESMGFKKIDSFSGDGDGYEWLVYEYKLKDEK